MARRPEEPFDRELAELPAELRWREWMARAEVVIFASPEPVSRATLARVVGEGCVLDQLVEDVAHALRHRPYEIVRVAGGWQMRTRVRYGPVHQAAAGGFLGRRNLSPQEGLVLAVIAYHQPITRRGIGEMIGQEVSRDLIGRILREGLIGRGPRSPVPGAPATYVTTDGFLAQFGLDSLRDLPDPAMAGSEKDEGEDRAEPETLDQGRTPSVGRV